MSSEGRTDRKNIETLVALTPLQRGILSYSLQHPESDPYFSQKVFRMEGRFHLEAMQRACQAVVDRHQALRGSYRWDDVAEPLQIVVRSLNVGVTEEDWRSVRDPEAALRQELETERARGFDFRRAVGL